jgi:putative hydrolase of the HAD superfamily
MGVLYRRADDVDELLVPYVRRRGSDATAERIHAVYLAASLGRISSGRLWEELGVAGRASDAEYCELHELTRGARELLADGVPAGVGVSCLSNDVAAWSERLRRRFGLDRAIGEWVVSGDVGHRKPDPAIYELTARRIGADGPEVLFVDDRPANLDAAAARGWSTVQFGGMPTPRHRRVAGFAELRGLLSGPYA